MLILPQSSHVLPVPPTTLPKASPKADLRREATAWRLLVWTYADELAHAATASGASFYAATGYSQSNWARAAAGFEHSGVTDVHEDALLIHGKLRAWFNFDGTALGRVIGAAQRRSLVPPAIVVPRVRAVPRIGRDAWPVERRTYRHGRVDAHFCLVDWEGALPEKAEADERAYAAFYGLFLAFLDVMPGFPLVKWKVVGRGLT